MKKIFSRTNQTRMSRMKTLILQREQHILPEFSDVPLDQIALNHIRKEFHPDFYYADIVMVKGAETTRIMKDIDGRSCFIRTQDADEYLRTSEELYKILL